MSKVTPYFGLVDRVFDVIIKLWGTRVTIDKVAKLRVSLVHSSDTELAEPTILAETKYTRFKLFK